MMHATHAAAVDRQDWKVADAVASGFPESGVRRAPRDDDDDERSDDGGEEDVGSDDDEEHGSSTDEDSKT